MQNQPASPNPLAALTRVKALGLALFFVVPVVIVLVHYFLVSLGDFVFVLFPVSQAGWWLCNLENKPEPKKLKLSWLFIAVTVVAVIFFWEQTTFDVLTGILLLTWSMMCALPTVQYYRNGQINNEPDSEEKTEKRSFAMLIWDLDIWLVIAGLTALLLWVVLSALWEKF